MIPATYKGDCAIRVKAIEYEIDIPFIEQFLDKEAISITSMTSVPLLKTLAEQKWSAFQVATAFCRRAAVAHQIVNY